MDICRLPEIGPEHVQGIDDGLIRQTGVLCGWECVRADHDGAA